MKNLRNILQICAIMLVLSSCSGQEEKVVNLETVTKDFNVARFYKKKLQLTTETLAKDPKKLNKEEALQLLNNPFIIKDTLCYFNDELDRFPGEMYIDNKSDWMGSKFTPVKTFGYAYKTVSWSEEKDTLAVLNKVPFPKVDMIESENGDLVLIKAAKSEMNQAVIDELERFLKSKYKAGKPAKSDFRDEIVSDYQNDDFIFRLIKMEKTYSVSSGGESHFVKKLEIEYLIFNKKYLSIIKEAGNRISGHSFEAYN